MTYPQTLHLTHDGAEIVVQRPTAQSVAMAARAALGRLTLADAVELWGAVEAWDADACKDIASRLRGGGG